MRALELAASNAAFSWKVLGAPHASPFPQALVTSHNKPGLKPLSLGWQACWQRHSCWTLSTVSPLAFQSSFLNEDAPKSEQLLVTPDVTRRIRQLSACGICCCEVSTRAKYVRGFKEGLEKLMENSSIVATSSSGSWEMAGCWRANGGGELYRHTQCLYPNGGCWPLWGLRDWASRPLG